MEKNCQYKLLSFLSSGEWQVSSSTDVNQELSSEGSSWEKEKTKSSNGHNTVSELFKMSHNGYSTTVSTWNSTKSLLTKDVNAEGREERKRNLAYSADHGKMKHQKLNSNNGYKSNPGYNPIQVGNNYVFYYFN